MRCYLKWEEGIGKDEIATENGHLSEPGRLGSWPPEPPDGVPPAQWLCTQARALEDLAHLPWVRLIFTPCCLESEAALVLWQERNLMPLGDGRSTGGER